MLIEVKIFIKIFVIQEFEENGQERERGREREGERERERDRKRERVQNGNTITVKI